MLHGHERAITQIMYNSTGDLLFSVAKDNKPTVWYSANGERLGTYNGHGGAVWCIDVNRILELCLLGGVHRRLGQRRGRAGLAGQPTSTLREGGLGTCHIGIC